MDEEAGESANNETTKEVKNRGENKGMKESGTIKGRKDSRFKNTCTYTLERYINRNT